MANIALDGDALRRDRQRYADLLAQAEQQIAAWNERADHLQQAVDGFDHLLALAGDDAALDGGVPRGLVAGRGAAPPAPARSVKASHAPAPEAGQPSAGGDAQPERPPVAAGSGPGGAARASERPARVASAGAERAPKVARATTVRKAPAAAVAPARPASAAPVTPAAPEPVVPPEAETPKGTDALRLVFESEAGRTWTLAELIAALGSRGWLPTSRRPEEGVRISLKRLAERGGAVRTDDGRWRLAGPGPERPPGAGNPGPERSPGAGNPGPERPPGAGGTWPEAAAPPAPTAPAAQAGPAGEQPAAEPPPPPADPTPLPAGTGTEV